MPFRVNQGRKMTETDPQQNLPHLTPRQLEVLKRVCKGLNYKTIADELVIEESTVKAHMGNIYQKLGLDELPPAQRTKIIFEVICPALKAKRPKLGKDTLEPEPVPEPVRRMVEEDERSLLVLRPKPEDIIEPVRPRGLSPFVRLGWFASGLMIGVIVMGGLFAGLVTPRIREQALADQVFPTAVVQLVENTVEVVVKETVEVPVEVEVMITNTPEPTQPSPTPIIQEIIITATSSPTPTELPITPPDSILEVGEWWKGDGVWVRVSDVEFAQYGMIYIDVEFWNKTGDTLIFEWSGPKNFSLADNTGHFYEIDWQSRGESSEAIDGDQLVTFSNGYGTSVMYDDEYVYQPEVIEMWFTVTGLSRIEYAKWYIVVPK
jgi:DNA-binding CsgD family transcriptional regulator